MEMTKERKFWELYKMFKSMMFIVRYGAVLCGRYHSASIQPFSKKDTEKDTDHVGAVAWIAALWKLFYERFPKELTGKTSKAETQYIVDYWKDMAMAMIIGLSHDMGELDTGDKADDGHRDPKEKAEQEYKAMAGVYGLLPDDVSKVLLTAFQEFQEESTEFGQMEYQFDKIEAVWQSIFFDFNAMPGDLQFKARHFSKITAQDQYFSDVIGSFDATQVWLAHYISVAHDMPGFDTLMAITDEAMKNVYGKRYAWLDDEKIMTRIKEWKRP